MEYSMEAVSKRMILVIVILSIFIAIGGGIFFFVNDNLQGIMPFAMGVLIAMVVNIIKVLWLKRTVERAVTMEESKAKLHLQVQYFIRLMLTAGAFLLAAFPLSNIVDLIGVFIAIFTLPIATYSVKLFLKDQQPGVL